MKANLPKSRTERLLSQLRPEQVKELEDYYRKKASFYGEEIAQETIKKGAKRIIECCIMLSMQTLITDFRFGTTEQKGRAPRLNKYITAFMEHAEDYSQEYDEAMYDALRMHLKQQGVTYDGIK